jgi:hypothetical protein
MQHDSQEPSLQEELELGIAEQQAEVDDPATPSQLDAEDEGGAGARQHVGPEACSDDAQLPSDDPGSEIEGMATAEEDDASRLPRWLQAVPLVGDSGRIRLRIGHLWRFVQNPLGLLAVALVGLMGVFALYKPDESQQPRPPPPTVPGVFPFVDYRTAERGAVTEQQAGALLDHYAAGNPQAAAAGHGQSCGVAAAVVATGEPAGQSSGHKAGRGKGKGKVTPTDRGDRSAGAVGRSADSSHRPAAAAAGGRGGRRRTRVGRTLDVPPVHAPQGALSEELPAFLLDPGGDDEEDADGDGSGAERLQLAVGARIEAVLDLGISSARHGTVVARTTDEVRDTAGQVIPKGAVLTGRSSSGHKRIYIELSGLRIGSVQYRLRGVATRGDDLGLEAERIETPLQERAGSRVADGALDVLKGLATVAGGRVAQALSHTAGGAVDEVQREQRIDRTVTLKVPAGTAFTVVITG